MNQDLWDNWGRLTRVLESGSIAFSEERDRVRGLGQPDKILDHSAGQKGRYRVTNAQHCDALDDESTFYAAVFTHFYALAEATALDALEPATGELTGGIQAWASKLLERNGKTYDDISCRPSPDLSLWRLPRDKSTTQGFMKGSLALLEVGLIRNLITHGGSRVNERTLDTLRGAGQEPAVVEGQLLTLSLDDVRNYKGRLAILLNVAGFQEDDAAYRPPK